MTAQDILPLITLGAIAGAFGQSLRVVVGLKKAAEEASGKGQSLHNGDFDGSRLIVSLLIGAVAGGIGILTVTGFADGQTQSVTPQLFFGVVGIGYAGTDFIEGFVRSYLPKQFTASSPIGGPHAIAWKREVGAQATPHGIAIPLAMADRIKETCERLLKIPSNAANCSGFAKSVCSNFSVTLAGQANEIVDQLTEANGWVPLGNDETSGIKAAAEAAKGHLVVGARMEAGNGHVVIVVEGSPLTHGKYPFAYWGKLDEPENAGFNKTINWAWDKNSRDSVTYASRKI